MRERALRGLAVALALRGAAQGADVSAQTVPAWAIGGYTYTVAPGQPGAYTSAGGRVGFDGTGDWAALLTAAPVEDVARALVGAWSSGMAAVAGPGTPLPRVTDAERAVVARPTVVRTGDGAVRLTVFLTTPADGAVYRLEVAAAPGARVTFTQTPLAALLSPDARVERLLQQAAAPDGATLPDVLAALGELDDPRATAALTAALRDGWAEARQAAALALAAQADRGRCGADGPVAALHAALRAESDDAAAFAEVRALAAIGGAEATAALQDAAARHPSAAVRARAGAAR